ncbi:MAG: hypothetical protein LBU11_09600 [Zoogloeaceae bacterium]|jgi:hypothetical protein|nr:hypothetical protein [Zoogloeaceae bacterium]
MASAQSSVFQSPYLLHNYRVFHSVSCMTSISSPHHVALSRVDALPEAVVAAMTDLYLAWYDGTSPELFRGDLREKDEAILLYHENRLVGFTALQTWNTEWRGKPARIVYSGDTIVDRPHWGQQALAFAWIARVGRIQREAPESPLYWFLLVKGHRTFKYLSVFGKRFFPHWQEDCPELRALAEQLAREKFGACYDPQSGVVHFPVSRGHMKAGISEPRPEELTKPAARFFLRRNPGYRQGDELVCLCALEAANMKPLAARIFSAA